MNDGNESASEETKKKPISISDNKIFKEDDEAGPKIRRLDDAMRTSPRHLRNPSTSSFRSVQADSPTDRPCVTFAIEDNPRHIGNFVVHPVTPKIARGFDMPLSPTLFSDRGSEAGDREEAEDDYSASVCAIIQRRNSSRRPSRRKKSRASSFAGEDAAEIAGASRRRSSVFTTSSGDTAISLEGDQAMEEDPLQEGGNQEQIFENLKLHKEVLSSVKLQPWPLRRKIKLVKQAKSYVRSHEGALQERLAQSRNTRDAVASASIIFNKKWQYFKRELVNLQTWMVPWEHRVKEIESHFGSAVASYFIFLRWLFWINLVVSLILAAFVAIPEVLTAKAADAGERKIMLEEEKLKSKHLMTLWEFEGVLKYSPFFYGWYTSYDPPGGGYRLPLAYFLANLIVYTYSFVAILRKMAENSRMSKLSEKEDECAFSWKLFTGWDFMIGNPETAHNRIASIVLGFKESLLEEAEKEKDLGHWKIITARVFVNLSVISLLAASAYAVVEVVERSTQPESTSGWWRQNEITVVMSLISYIFPIFFEILGIFENYHPRKQLRFQLARIMMLNLLNLYSLIFALFKKIDVMERQLRALKPDDFNLAASMISTSSCRNVSVPCDDSSTISVSTVAAMTLALTSSFTLNNISSDRSNYYMSQSYVSPLEAPMSLVLMSNSTLDESSDNRSSYYEPRVNDSPDEILMGIDEILDSGATDNYSASSTLESTPNTLSARSDTSDTWISHHETDVEDQSNYEDFWDHNDYQDSAEENSTSTASVSVRESNDSTMSSPTDWINITETEDESTSPVDVEECSTRSPSGINSLVGTPEVTVKFLKCYVRICDVCSTSKEYLARRNKPASWKLDMKTRRTLRKLCWETMFGQELAKLTVMDLVLTVIATMTFDFFRALFTRHMNSCWCWDLEKKFPQYGDFKIAENILHLVNNQGMVWMGMFFSPGLAALNLLKLGILMYLRSWAVLTCNVPHEVVFRASRSNNFYLALLLTMLFLCVLPVGYALVWVEPSWHCGPFSEYQKIYHIATQSLKDALPGTMLHKCLDYIASPGIVIPLIVLMALIIYYMVSLASSLREANNDLKVQLRQERTEERRKMFKIAEKRGQVQDTPFTRWKKILPTTGGKSTEMPTSIAISNTFDSKHRREAVGVQSTNSEADEATDVEPNSSLPHDPALNLPGPAEHEDYDTSRKTTNGHNGSRGDIRTSIPKIRIDSTDATGELLRDLSLEEATFRSDSTI